MSAAGLRRASSAVSCATRPRIGHVALGDDQAIGDRDLLAAFRIAVELLDAMHGVDGGDDRAGLELVAKHGIADEREQHRRRIGEPGGLEDRAANGGSPPCARRA